MIKSKFDEMKYMKDYIMESIGAIKGKLLHFKGSLMKSKGEGQGGYGGYYNKGKNNNNKYPAPAHGRSFY